MTTWAYDAADRLTAEVRSDGPPGTFLDLSHAYDAAGNRTSLGDGVTVTTYTNSDANRLQSADAGGVSHRKPLHRCGMRTA